MIKRIFIWLGVFAVLAIMISVMTLAASKNEADVSGKLETPVSQDDWSFGTTTAKVTLVEYGDFQCPACQAYHFALKKLLEERGNEISFVFRHFPLITIHPNALPGALASEAAGKQGKFWEMHDLLYEKQTDWSNDVSAEQRFVEYAKELGLDTAKFLTDYKDPVLRDKITDSYKSGMHSGVSGTPTFFINGEKIVNPGNYDELKAIIDQKLTN